MLRCFGFWCSLYRHFGNWDFWISILKFLIKFRIYCDRFADNFFSIQLPNNIIPNTHQKPATVKYQNRWWHNFGWCGNSVATLVQVQKKTSIHLPWREASNIQKPIQRQHFIPTLDYFYANVRGIYADFPYAMQEEFFIHSPSAFWEQQQKNVWGKTVSMINGHFRVETFPSSIFFL